MKRTITALALIGLIAISAVIATPRGKAQSQERKSGNQTVILWGTTDSGNIGGGLVYRGIVVYNSSSSDGAPRFPGYGSGEPLIGLADAIATLKDRGFDVRPIDNYGLAFMATKN